MKRSSQFFQCSTQRCAAALHKVPCGMQIEGSASVPAVWNLVRPMR